MKKQIHSIFKLSTFIIVLLLSHVSGLSQIGENDFCYVTSPTNSNLGGDCDPIDASVPLYIKIYMHVITDENGEGGLTNEEVGEAFALLQSIYSSADIFFVWCGDINTIKSNYYFNAPDMATLSQLFVSSYKHDSGIDLFLAPEDHAVNGGRANGIAGSSELVIAGKPRVVPTNLPLALTHVIAHEMGHVLGLYHTHEEGTFGIDDGITTDCEETGDLCCMTPPDPNINNIAGPLCGYVGVGGYSPDMGNIMSYTPPRCMTGFKSDQIEKMRSTINCTDFLQETITTPLANACSCSQGLIIIHEDTEYNENKSISNHIYIRQGATLTINNATLYFAENAGIRVFGGGKLVLNGATLTKCILANHWKGVQLNEHINFFGIDHIGGEIEAIAGSRIEYAIVGVKAYSDANDPFSIGLIGAGGGKVQILDGSTIENCRTGLLLGSSNQDDDYIIQDSHILECPVGIQVHQAGLNVEGTEFEDCDEAIIVESIFPNVQQVSIGNNTFEHFDCAIYAGSISALDNLLINDNTIEDGETGIFVDGHSNFDIRENIIFDNESGIVIHATGDNQLNNIIGNEFSTHAEACNVQFRTSSQFWVNCFYDSEVADIAILNGSLPNPSKISEFQGSNELSAGNCFSDSKFQFSAEGPENNITSFKYYTSEINAPESCQHPGTSPGCMFDSGTQSLSYCFEIFESLETNGDCDDEFTPLVNDDCIFDSTLSNELIVESLLNDIETIRLNTQLTPLLIEREINQKQDCLSKFIRRIVKELLEEGEIERAITFLASIPDFNTQIIAYGLLMKTYDIERAEQQLNAIATTETDELDFIAVQQIYLKYLNDIDFFVLLESDQQMIKNVANTDSPLAGYAKAVHHLLAGQRIVSEIEHLRGKGGKKHLTKKASNGTQSQFAFIYPNPIKDDLLNINIQQEYIESDQFILKTYNLQGHLLQQWDIQWGHNQVHVSDYPQGIYLLVLEKNGVIMTSEKIVK